MFDKSKVKVVKVKVVGSLVGLGFLMALIPNIALAQKAVQPWQGNIPRKTLFKTDMEVAILASGEEQTSQFQKIEQPLSLKLAVTLGGLSLIGAELWWFVFSKTKS